MESSYYTCVYIVNEYYILVRKFESFIAEIVKIKKLKILNAWFPSIYILGL